MKFGFSTLFFNNLVALKAKPNLNSLILSNIPALFVEKKDCLVPDEVWKQRKKLNTEVAEANEGTKATGSVTSACFAPSSPY